MEGRAAIDTGVTVDNVEVMKQMRKQKQNLKANIAALSEGQKPLRWVNRVITWCADKRPSFADGVPGSMGFDNGGRAFVGF